MERYQHYIGGQWVDPAAGDWFDSVNPYTGDVWAKIAKGNAADVDRAVTSAKNAFESGWADVKPTERGRLLY